MFKDGTTAECDVLIGADGLKSATRRTMFEDMALEAEVNGDLALAIALRRHIRAKYSGATVYRTIIPRERLTAISSEHRVLSRPMQVRQFSVGTSEMAY
jgi:salicylate hydroxylase